MRNAIEMIAIGDNNATGSWDYNLDPLQADQYPGKVHFNGCNILFCDGHVSWYLQTDLILPNFDPTSPRDLAVAAMWNNSRVGAN